MKQRKHNFHGVLDLEGNKSSSSPTSYWWINTHFMFIEKTIWSWKQEFGFENTLLSNYFFAFSKFFFLVRLYLTNLYTYRSINIFTLMIYLELLCFYLTHNITTERIIGMKGIILLRLDFIWVSINLLQFLSHYYLKDSFRDSKFCISLLKASPYGFHSGRSRHYLLGVLSATNIWTYMLVFGCHNKKKPS